MKPLTSSVLIGLLLAGTTVMAEASGQGRGRGHAKADTTTTTRVDAHVVFVSGDVAILREYYTPRYRNLPPGLQKKLARGGQLPPGWQKKFESFPVEIEHRLTPLPTGYRRGVIDGHAIIFNPRTNLIVDLAVLF